MSAMKQKNLNQKTIQKKPTVQLPKFDAYTWWKDKNTLLMAALLIVITFVVMFPSLKGEFLYWDDDVNIYENQNVKQLTTENVKKIFSESVIGNYNPLTILSFAVEYHFFGEKTFNYHLHNILLHIINAFFVFWLLMLFRLRREWALFGALLFAIHPMRVESVAWITERKDVLFAMFYLAAMLSYIYHLKLKKKRFLVLTFVLFILSLLSKIQAVSFPLALLLVDYLLKRPLKFKLLLEKIPYFLLSLAVGLLGVYFLGQQKSLDNINYSVMERVLLGSYGLCAYLVKFIAPYSLSAIYPFPIQGKFGIFYYIAPFALIALAVLVYFSTRKSKTVLFGSLFFLVNIVFILQVVSAGQGFLADRFSYVPYIGLVFMMAQGGEWLADKRKKLLPMIGIVAVAMVLFYAGYSFNRVGVWKTTETLFTDVLKYDKNVSVAFRNRGNYYRDHKINDKAMDDYANLMRLTPNDPNAYFSRGKLYFEKKDYDKAFNDFNKSIKLDSNNAIAFSNRGTIYGTRQQWDLALKDFNRALVLKPDMKDALLNRGLLFYNLRRFDEAIKDLDYYCTLQPGNSKAINLRGLCKVSKQDYQGALKDYDESLLLDQTEGNYFLNRALLYSFLGNKLKAFADAQKAQQMGIKVDPAFMEKIKK